MVKKVKGKPLIWFEEITKLYKLIDENAAPSTLVRGSVEGDPTSAVIFTYPVGRAGAPRTELGAETFLRDSIEALDFLHENGWTHGDMRLPNVVRVADHAHPLQDKDCKWFVIDLDDAMHKRTKTVKPWPTEATLAKEFHPPRAENEQWGPKHDFWQLYFLCVADFELGPDDENKLKILKNLGLDSYSNFQTKWIKDRKDATWRADEQSQPNFMRGGRPVTTTLAQRLAA
jgi:serine/threonine protein kinase